MAVTVANVSHPNQTATLFSWGPYKAILVDITFDSSYDNANGEAVTASQLGFQRLDGVITVFPPWNGSTSDKALLARAVPNASNSQIAIRIFGFDGDDTGNPSAFSEFLDTANLSAYTGRFLFFGS